MTSISGISRQKIIQQIIQSDNNLKPEAMTIIDEFILEGKKEGIQEGKKEGIEKGEKISIYDAYKRGKSLEMLSDFFDLPVKKIKQIIEEIENEIEQ